MERQDIILAALSAANGNLHSPVQMQKLLFLIDKEISDLIDGPYFKFIPYNYGPFDKSIYEDLGNLIAEKLVEMVRYEGRGSCKLTVKGQKKGEDILKSMPVKARGFIERTSAFVRETPFGDLVAAIYKAYPEMKANSVFQE